MLTSQSISINHVLIMFWPKLVNVSDWYNPHFTYETLSLLCKFVSIFCAETHLLDCLINLIQAGGGAQCAPLPYRFLPCCAQTVCNRLMKLSDF